MAAPSRCLTVPRAEPGGGGCIPPRNLGLLPEPALAPPSVVGCPAAVDCLPGYSLIHLASPHHADCKDFCPGELLHLPSPCSVWFLWWCWLCLLFSTWLVCCLLAYIPISCSCLFIFSKSPHLYIFLFLAIKQYSCGCFFPWFFFSCRKVWLSVGWGGPRRRVTQ